ncbi:threonine-phosphate decarboxylase CobD [Alteribacillus sp. JSM 102045]|uniref:threonine-phosphate decarboxylase CobD n=1 Tax=Alteribacillus sp. JSM 102045 TaxID=1562101 RepID=UPI0035BFD0CD
MSWPEHGAMPAALSEQLNQVSNKSIIDFSVNTNPYGPPADIKKKLSDWVHTVHEYPDPNSNTLRKRLAQKLSCNFYNVMPGNGGAELIQAAARLFTNKKVILVQPTFTEYKKALEANGAEIVSYLTNEEEEWKWKFQELEPLLEKADGIWFCHPNNPTGTASASKEIEELLQYCKTNNKLTVVDEAFYDFQESPFLFESFINKNFPLILLRSMTKMYTLPGLRMGYMLASEEIIKKIQIYLPPWNINSIAGQAMMYLINQEEFVHETVQLIQKEKQRVIKQIQALKHITVFPSDVNFYLIRHHNRTDMQPLLKFLVQNGIHARHTYHFPGLNGKYIRLAVKKKSENDQLLHMLTRWSG